MQPSGGIQPPRVVLHQPEIAPNTGAVMRLCAAAGAELHLVGPLGFRLDAPGVKRAGMDYRELAEVRRHADWAAFLAQFPPGEQLTALSTKGATRYSDWRFQPGEWLLFGSEGSGLPPELLAACGAGVVRIPMRAPARSLNLAQSVAIVLYEAMRQLGHPGTG
ncbi:MAG: tRNA (cytidine(34)-2'-O)-methyltransferase [Magnetococcales bacterium]|nr:tRNA (cytidine(34)-2'-O)-methyltransferase [Magnetococcales bacterium]